MTFIMADTGVQTQQPEQKQETKRKVKRVEWHVLPKSMSGGPHGIGKKCCVQCQIKLQNTNALHKGQPFKQSGRGTCMSNLKKNSKSSNY